ncbi:hypothetical protein QTP70_027477 [Hemibagrus guttatus]|uniref:DUF1279 domain-containing protein n=1 Tax=Hemibagrus guttatus TaxID=175788 RepID=A0AAE0Q1I8_9TELE|nr:hypothetical protein QTP70_027477 [Hemibagrus guttatus]
MMRFLCAGEFRRFVQLSPVWSQLSCESLSLSQTQLGSGWRWICTSPSSSAPGRTPPGDGQLRQDESPDADPLQDQSVGLAQRFKRTFKQYGKVMIPVHLLTSCMWFGGFYYAAMKGVNLLPFLEHVGLPEKLIKLLENSQSGYALTAYAMYKIATPARYTLTLGGTSLSVKYLRKHSYMSTPPPVKEYLQEKMEETKERFSERIEETKDKFTEKLQETKDKVGLRKKPE